MAEVLVLVEAADGAVKKVTTELLTLARTVGEPSAVWIGPGYSDAVAATLAEFGAAKVYVADGAQYVEHPVAPKAEVLAKLVADVSPVAVIIASSAEGKEIGARLAVRTNSGIITDAVGLTADLVATQSIFGGSTVVQSKVSSGTPIITIRPNSTGPVPSAGAAARSDVSVDLSPAATLATITGRSAATKLLRALESLRRWQTHLVLQWAHPVQPPMLAGTRTPSRSDRPERRSRRSSTSPMASRAPSSTALACRPRR